MKKEKLLKEMEQLKKKLVIHYPVRSYCHADIFTAYWKLYETIDENY